MRGPTMPNLERRRPALVAALRLLPLLLALAGVAWADTGYCPSPYCGTGRPDPWPGDVPLPNEQLLAAYTARYGQPPGSGGSRAGYCCELFGANWTALENACRAGQLDAFAAQFGSDAPAMASSSKIAPALAALPLPYRDGLEALDAEAAAGELTELEYASRRVALQALVPKSKSSAHNCLATTTEATDSSFAHPRQGSFMGQWWWAFVDGGRSDNPIVVHDTTRACGPYSQLAPVGYLLYYDNTPPCGVPAPRCGDGHADPGETCASCPADLGPCPPPPPPPDNALHLGPAGRFKVEATWTTPATPAVPSRTGPAKPLVVKRDGGSFTLFDVERPELYVTVVAGCPVNGRWWVFTAGLTNVKIDLKVTDTSTGAAWAHGNPQGQVFSTTLDTGAFSCP